MYKKQRKKNKNPKKQETRYIYQGELDKACFPHGMAYGA